jgi:hypothetical protein
VSGPVVPGRLSSSVAFTQTETENVGAVHATLPEGVFALGITRPFVSRQINVRSTYQIADTHSVRGFLRYGTETGRDQGFGGFTLPERRFDELQRPLSGGIFPFSAPSARHLFEGRLQVSSFRSDTIPFLDAPRINVLDAFSGGGAQNRSGSAVRDYQFGNLYTRFGDRVTLKTGMDGGYRVQRSTSTANFGGTFTFSSLEAYLAHTPLTYRVNRGDPLLDTRQLEAAGFVQADLALTPQLSVLAGVRYEVQQNLGDDDNVAPRVAVAWAPGPKTIVRAGGGVFYSRLSIGFVENQRRFDGTRQFEIVIDSPSYPDPMAGGTVRRTFPSIRVTDTSLMAPSAVVGMVSLERTFFSNLLFLLQSALHAQLRSRARAPQVPDAQPECALRRDLARPARLHARPACGRMREAGSVEGPRDQPRVDGRRDSAHPSREPSQALQHLQHVGDLRAAAGLRGRPGRRRGARHRQLQPARGLGPGAVPAPQPQRERQRPSAVRRLPDGRDELQQRAVLHGDDRSRRQPRLERDRSAAGRGPQQPARPAVRERGLQPLEGVVPPPRGRRRQRRHPERIRQHDQRVQPGDYGSPSGVMTSPNFGRSTSAQDPREIEAGLRFQF